jgi:hypothetical protein
MIQNFLVPTPSLTPRLSHSALVIETHIFPACKMGLVKSITQVSTEHLGEYREVTNTAQGEGRLHKEANFRAKYWRQRKYCQKVKVAEEPCSSFPQRGNSLCLWQGHERACCVQETAQSHPGCMGVRSLVVLQLKEKSGEEKAHSSPALWVWFPLHLIPPVEWGIPLLSQGNGISLDALSASFW